VNSKIIGSILYVYGNEAVLDGHIEGEQVPFGSTATQFSKFQCQTKSNNNNDNTRMNDKINNPHGKIQRGIMTTCMLNSS